MIILFRLGIIEILAFTPKHMQSQTTVSEDVVLVEEGLLLLEGALLRSPKFLCCCACRCGLFFPLLLLL